MTREVLIGLGGFIGGLVVGYAINEFMSKPKRQQAAETKENQTTEDNSQEKEESVTKWWEKNNIVDSSETNWKEELEDQIKARGMGKFEEELDCFVQQFVQVQDADDFVKWFDELRDAIQDPDSPSQASFAVFAGVTALFHLRIRVEYDSNPRISDDLKHTASVLPMMAMQAAQVAQKRPEKAKDIMNDIVEQVMKGTENENEWRKGNDQPSAHA